MGRLETKGPQKILEAPGATKKRKRTGMCLKMLGKVWRSEGTSSIQENTRKKTAAEFRITKGCQETLEGFRSCQVTLGNASVNLETPENTRRY